MGAVAKNLGKRFVEVWLLEKNEVQSVDCTSLFENFRYGVSALLGLFCSMLEKQLLIPDDEGVEGPDLLHVQRLAGFVVVEEL